jgi:hypothetical protein
MPHITGKASHHFEKGLNFSENIFKMPRILHSQKKPSGIAALPQWPVRPWSKL